MPELPEVQTIVDDLSKKVVGRKIIGVWFDAPKIIKNPRAGELGKQIKGLKINSVERRGKNILIYLTNYKLPITNYLLLIHQKMTGHLLVGKWKITKVLGCKSSVESLLKGPLEEKVNKYIHIIFYLDNGKQLGLSDLRKFAKVVFGPKQKIELLPELEKLGPDPLAKDFTFEKFSMRIARLCPSGSGNAKGHIRIRKSRSIKEVLMDQNLIAGIGNIYSDEILWLAKIHPLRRSNTLNVKELKNIYNSMKVILKKGIKLRGTSISDFRDTAGKSGFYSEKRYVYRKEGEKCPRGNGIIKRIKIKNRSAHYCPACQSLL
ncbi:DNA-formamidopyrimidine glycosylase [Candidatus Wolfebacteria bacterium]|nr:DNA-formamidopyrimidine glycosylase [Candidatus Wolfebacteria bacterium]